LEESFGSFLGSKILPQTTIRTILAVIVLVLVLVLVLVAGAKLLVTLVPSVV